MKIVIDTTARTLTEVNGAVEKTVGLYTKEAFEALSLAWVRVGWNLEYYHNFTWFGQPILQLPEDLVRIQEVVYALRPAVIVETGVFKGGSLLFHASLLAAIGEGKVIGIDREISPRTREALSRPPLAARISLLEGDSTDPQIAAQVADLIGSASPVLVILDSGHSRDHVARELECYAPLVTKGSYIIATDGIMKDIADGPRAFPEWKTDNPFEAAKDFAARHHEFRQHAPAWPTRHGPLTENVTYWPGAWLRRVK
jgi:cephalosporin hydroxylase